MEKLIYRKDVIFLSDNQMSFNDVNPDINNGLIQSKGITIKSTCYNAPQSSQLYVNVSSKNSPLNQEGNRIISTVERNGNEAIGVIFAINENYNCNNSDTFNLQCLGRNRISGGKVEAYNNTMECLLNLALSKSATINITTK